MQQPRRFRLPLARSLDRALVAIGVAGIAVGLLELSVMPLDGPVGALLIAVPFVFWSYLFAGLIAWRRRPSNPIGALILWVGFAVCLGGVANTEVPALIATGAITATLALAAVVHLLLAFPVGRLQTLPARVVVIFTYVFSLVIAAPLYLFDPAGRFPPFAVADLPEVVAWSQAIGPWAGFAIVVATVIILVARLRDADRRHRRVLVPLYSYGILTVLFIPFSSLLLSGVFGMDPVVRGGLQFVVVGALPIAFAFGILRGGFARTGELIELGSWLGSARLGRHELRAALARTLGDPSLRLYFWSADRAEFVDEVGTPQEDDVDLTEVTGRGWQEIHVDDRIIGAIDYDAALLTDPTLVRTAGNVIAIAVERERLTTELLASRRELIRSRGRIVDAADRERHRIARDLHDGLQVQLLLLAIEAQKLASAMDAASPARAGATRLRHNIDDAARALRTLVHDLVPPALIERGLAIAAEDLADRMPIPTRIHAELPAGRLPRAVEHTAYFVIAEALTNVVKHSRATMARVHLRHDAGVLRMHVRDNGVGDVRIEDGSGLRGMADRVEALGGTVDLTSTAGEGTNLRVELPCVS